MTTKVEKQMKTNVLDKPKDRRHRSSKGVSSKGAKITGTPARKGARSSAPEKASSQTASPVATPMVDPIKTALAVRLGRFIEMSLRDATPASLQHALEAPTDAGSAARLLSMAANSTDAVRVLDPLARSIMRGASIKQDLLKSAGVLTTADVMSLLGITRQAIAKRVQRGTLLALPDASGNLQFPSVQFTDTGTVEGLEGVLSAFTVESPWTRLAVLLDTDPAIGGKRVIDALHAGN